MKIELKKKIETIIQGYKASFETQVQEVKQVIDEWKDQVNAYKPEYIKEQISSELVEISKNHSSINENYNQQIKDVVANAKSKFIPKVPEKSTDYATKISNAIELLKIKGESITDDSAFMILKDFIDDYDYDQMRIFKDIIETLTRRINAYGLIGADGKNMFPNTFGKLIEVEVVHNTFAEIETSVKNIFLHPKQNGQTYIINGHGYALPEEVGAELEVEDMILGWAEIIDKTAEKVPGVEKIPDATDHETVEN